MEKFRELEKYYKQKNYTKVVYQNHSEIESKYIFSDSDSCEDRDNSNSDNDEESKSDDVPHSNASDNVSLDSQSDQARGPDEEDLAPGDREWCNVVLTESMRKIAGAFEQQITQLRQNKNKSAQVAKKNREKIS